MFKGGVVLFKGYIETKNKRATKKWKNEKLQSLEDVKNSEEYAGILAEDTILLDCDKQEQAEIIARIIKDKKINCKIIQTTRGKHFYFKGFSVNKCKTDYALACGLKADFKVGASNSYSILKYNGVERACEYDTGVYDDVPFFLKPIGKKEPEFLNMQKGDGRNSGLYGYLLTLQRNGFSKDECIEIVRVINQYIFDDRLDDAEIASITRDGAFKKEVFFQKGKFLHDKFGNWLVKEENIIKLNNQLHTYIDGVYRPGHELVEQKMIKHIPSIKDTQRREVLKYLNIF